jgi:hypothetical protein
MPIDYEQVRANNIAREAERQNREAVEGIQRGNPALAGDEAAWLHQRRQEEAGRREEETHRSERRDFAGYACDRALEARRNGRDYEAKVWDEAVIHINKDMWPISKVIRSDPGVTRFASLQTRLNYRGSNVQIPEE